MNCILNIIDFSERTTYRKMFDYDAFNRNEMVCYVPGSVEEFDTK